jgi:phosphoglycolate phosphatase
MSVIKGLLFDKDGTLFDFSATWGGWTRRVVTELAGGASGPAADLAGLLGFDADTGRFRPDSAVIAHTTGEIAALLLPRLPGWRIGPLIQRLNEMAAENEMTPAVPLEPLFRRFAELGLKVGLATNDAEDPARQHLRGAGIEEHFDFVSGFDSGWGGKPGTGQMQAFLDVTGLAPGEVAMVGDSLHDLHAGRAAGMRTVAVLTGIAGASDLHPHADVVLPDIGTLPDWISAQAGPRG